MYPIAIPKNYDAENHSLIENSAEQIINKATQTLYSRSFEAKTEILVGSPANCICDYAKSVATDLIVIGSRGLGGIKKLVLGSVSQNVIELAHCSVLVGK